MTGTDPAGVPGQRPARRRTVTIVNVLVLLILLIAVGVFVNEWITRRPPPMP